MKNKSLDSISKRQPNQSRFGGTRVSVNVTFVGKTTEIAPKEHGRITYIRNVYYPKLPIFLTGLLMLAAFGAGMWYNMQTQNTDAETPTPVTSTPYVPLVLGAQGMVDINNVPNDVLFNLPLGQLETYLNDVNTKQQQVKQEEILAERVEQIKNFLEEHGSPLASSAKTIAQQPHWKLILAISFAESSLGKRCYNNNCSNIGVAPGHPLWRKYATLDEWVVDFNSLLEKKYKDWSLEQMNGVYVQPKNPNWLTATKQILGELQDRKIE